MEEPDYDDLIDDCMADYDEEPPTAAPEEYYDEELFEEMAAANDISNNTTTDTNAAASTNLTVDDDLMQTEGESPISTNFQSRIAAASPARTTTTTTAAATTTSATSPSAQVRSDFGSARGDDENYLYSFERYKRNAAWRPDKSHSPRTMRAKEWKSKNAITVKTSSKKATTPEAQLLQYQSQFHHVRNPLSAKTIKIRPYREKGMSTRATPTKVEMAMTLGNGNRIFVQVLDIKATTPPKTTRARLSNETFSLGMSISELIGRVKTTQRQKEHSRLKALSRELRNQQKELSKKGGDDGEEDDEDDEMEETENKPDPQVTKPEEPVDDRLWVDKHAPSTFANLLSDERTNREVLRALREWDPYVFHRDPPPRPKYMTYNNEEEAAKNLNPKDKRPPERARVLLLSGAPGVGKTTLAHIVAHHCGYRPLEVNGSDERSASVLLDRVVRAMETATLDMQASKKGNKTKGSWKGRPNCLILDEIDGADAKQALQALVELIRQDIPDSADANKNNKRNSKPYLKRPIIFICNNLYAPALRPLLPYAKKFQVEAPAPSRLVARLRAVLAAERLSLWGGATLLHDLVTATGGDIRSCLYTLQFAAAEVQAGQDISKSLQSALHGNGMKDDRTDIAGTTMTVFKKLKPKAKKSGIRMSDPRTSVERVLDAIEGFGEHNKILDCLSLNLLNVSYIDPTFDRCALAMQWLSGADLYGFQNFYVPCAAAALHLLCRVEKKPELSYTTRALVDAKYQKEANLGLANKFAEGFSAHFRGSRCTDAIIQDIVPYALWMLSSGEGSMALNRPASSVELLNKNEQAAFNCHVATLTTLGLTYVAAPEDYSQQISPYTKRRLEQARFMLLEPPIDRLVQFQMLRREPTQQRREVPGPLRELLARHSMLQSIGAASPTKQPRQKKETAISTPKKERKQQHEAHGTPIAAHGTPSKAHGTPKKMLGHSPLKAKATYSPSRVRNKSAQTAELNGETVAVTKPRENTDKENKNAIREPPEKRQKVQAAQNFLGLGARRARERKSARRAKNVGGFVRSKADKKSNAGSGIPFGQVVRLKYVKGFTQAVRNPCRLEDLA